MPTTELIRFFVFAFHVENVDRESAMLEMKVPNRINNFLEMTVVVIENEAWKRPWCGKECPKEDLQYMNRLEHPHICIGLKEATYAHTIRPLRPIESCTSEYDPTSCNTELLVVSAAATKTCARPDISLLILSLILFHVNKLSGV